MKPKVSLREAKRSGNLPRRAIEIVSLAMSPAPFKENPMNRRTTIHAIILACTLLALTSCTQLKATDAAKQAEPADSTALKAIFAEPPRQYATAPLWTWNDMLTEDQIRSTMRDLASQKVMQVFVHPRPGLMTPYLSDDWFRLWKVALDEAEKLDMNVWIYDENSYPSGFAGYPGLCSPAMRLNSAMKACRSSAVNSGKHQSYTHAPI